MNVTITKCARCGETHPDLVFRPFTVPNPTYDYWAPCPKTQEPILLRKANA